MSTLKDNYWPNMSTSEAAEKGIERAAFTAYCVAGVTALFSLLAWIDVFHLLTPLALIDALLFAVTGFFISRRSRIAAILGLTLYLIEVLDRVLSGKGGSMGGFSVLAVFFTMFFINGIRGSFSLVRIARRNGEVAPLS